MRAIIWLGGLAVVVAGCGATTDDGRPDHWPGDDLAPCDTTRRSYVIDELRLPTDRDEVDAYGRDFDHDGSIDNQGGRLLAAAQDVLGVDLQAEVDATLATDLVQIVLTVEQCAAPRYARISVSRGFEIDRTLDPPRVLADDVTALPAVAPRDVPGAAGYGWAQLPAPSLVHLSQRDWLEVPQLAIDVDRIDDAAIEGVLAGAFDHGPFYDAITAAVTAVIADRVARLDDCEPAACEDIETLLGLFDENEDYVVSLDEVRTSSLTQTLLLPDVDGDLGPGWGAPTDGINDQIALGVGFHASRVALYVGQAR